MVTGKPGRGDVVAATAARVQLRGPPAVSNVTPAGGRTGGFDTSGAALTLPTPMYRTSVIVRHTFVESVLQPIYALTLALGAVILLTFAALPFFTLGEDTKMFKAVGLDVLLVLVLLGTLFACSRSIFEEIEDRTMLTLMSKPIRKWEVLVGKYLGIVGSALLAVVILGGLMALCLYWRIPGDAQLRTTSPDDRELLQIADLRRMNLAGLWPSLVLMWFQVSTLAAIGVALSTRFSLVVNLPAVLLFYIAGNLTRFLGTAVADQQWAVRGLVYLGSLLLPYLEIFDLRPLTVFATVRVGQTFADDPQGVSLWTLWSYVGLAFLYCATYSAFVLAAGMWVFETRELGGNEG